MAGYPRRGALGTLAGVGDGIDDDDFDEAVRRLLEPDEAQNAPYEPSAAERARAARQADLVRRLAEQEEHERRLAERDRQQERKASRAPRRARWLAPLIVIALIGAAIYLTTNRSGEALAGDPGAGRPSNWPPAADDVSDTPLGTPPPVPAEKGPFVFASTQDGSAEPITWDPCRPIRYVVNPSGAPPGGQELIEDAVARTSAATGLEFEYEGTTDETWSDGRTPYQPDRYGERWAPVLITWTTPAAVPELAGLVAGQGGPTAVGLAEDELVHVTGGVVLDADQLNTVLGTPDGAVHVRSVIQHELGHVVGLDHVDDPTQLMHPEASTVTDWGAGDLHGLHALGSGECHPEI